MNHHKTHLTARPNMCAKYYIWPYLDSRVKNYDQISFLAVFPIFPLHLSKMILFSLPPCNPFFANNCVEKVKVESESCLSNFDSQL